MILIALSALACQQPLAQSIRQPDPTWPPNDVSGPVSASAGQTVTLNATMAGSSATTEYLYITDANGKFSSLPSSVTVPAGQTHVSFQGTIAANASGSAYVTVYNSLGSATTSAIPISFKR